MPDERQSSGVVGLLSPLLDTADSLRTAYRRRREEFEYQKIHPADEQKFVDQGWMIHRPLQSALWIKKPKSVDRLLEDRVWSLFYRMGYPVLSGGNFRIYYDRSDGSRGSKQIDVFAKDSETAIIVECKAREVLGRRQLQKDIHETENLQKHFSASVRLANIRIPAAKGTFGRHTYYSFAVSARHLLKIAYVNHQALNHPDGRPAYQRMINKNRIANIGQFIRAGGFFPTNILVNFMEECRFDLLPNKHNTDKNNKFGWLYLPNKYKSAWVIDGQHRLYGFSNIDQKFLDNTLFVVAFEKMNVQTEAELFITINHEQRSVPKSLLVALLADLKLGSENPREALSALASALVRSMTSDSSSPFFRRFETPGIPSVEAQNLTIAEAVKGLVRSSLLGRTVGKKVKVPGFLSAQTDHESLSRARKILNGYFKSIMDANSERWSRGQHGYVCVNPGIRAHLLLVQEVLQYLSTKGVTDPYTASPDLIIDLVTDFVEPLRAFLTEASGHQIEDKFARKFGEGGGVEYFYNMCEIVGRKHKEFGSDEFKKYKSQQADARIQQADRDIGDLEKIIRDVVVAILKKVHGTDELPSGERAYWDLGIDNLDIKQAAYKKQQSNPAAKRAPKEVYLDLIDYDKIMRQASNWPSFEPIFGVPLRDEQKGKKYYLSWLERLNELRRIMAHKSSFRTYSEEDLEFISWIKRQLFDRFAAAGFDPSKV